MEPDVAIRHERVRADGVDLHVARAGEGRPVILLHGFPENWRSWKHQLPALARAGFSVWAPDLRGYNLSDRPASREAYHMRHLVADVAALVDATDAGRAHIAGHDWGGVIAWTFAGHHAELVDKLVILNAPHLQLYSERVRRPPQLLRAWYLLLFRVPWFAERVLSAHDFRAIRRMFRGTPARTGTFSAGDVQQYVDALRQPGALSAALNYYRANAASDARDMACAARIAAPTLVLWGEQDPALGIELLAGLEQVAPRLQVHRFPETGHWVQNERPEEVSRLMIAFLGA